MQTTQVTIFGPNRDDVDDVVSNLRSICQKKGIETKGPYTYPVVHLSSKNADLDEDDVELFGEKPSDYEIEELENERLFSRGFTFHRYSSDNVLNKIVKRDYPDRVFLRVKVEESDFITAKKGTLFTYDPNADYNSDI